MFSSIGEGGALGHLKHLLWSLANFECFAANIMRGVANIFHGPTVILRGIACNLSNVPENILNLGNDDGLENSLGFFFSIS